MSHVRQRVEASWAPFLPPLKKSKKFDHLHVMAAVVRRLESQKLKLEKDGPADALRIVVEDRAPHEFTKFFLDPRDVEAAVRRCAPGAIGDLVAAISTIPLPRCLTSPRQTRCRPAATPSASTSRSSSGKTCP